jgi:hypothetical protein
LNWIDFIVQDLRPSFGGFPTFVEDPDELLQDQSVITSLKAAGLTIDYWDGSPETLTDWTTIDNHSMPLVIVEPAYPKHLIEASLTAYRFESISIGEIFWKFHSPTLKLVPKEFWKLIFDQQQIMRPCKTESESVHFIARSCFGIDPLFIENNSGWSETLLRMALLEKSVPEPLAVKLMQHLQPPDSLNANEMIETLSDPVICATRVTELFKGHNFRFSSSNKVNTISQVAESSNSYGRFDWQKEWEGVTNTPSELLAFSLLYGRACAENRVTNSDRIDVNKLFFEWMKSNYEYVMTSNSSATLRLPTLVKRLDEETGSDPLLFVVVDALGLESWFAIEKNLQDRIRFTSAETKSAFAVIPTLTILSRRAIFEGKMPSQFGPGDHSQSLEKKLWTERFRTDGAYISVNEPIKLDHAFARRTSRIAVVDTEWDSMGHAIFPQSDSIPSAAIRWARATRIADVIKDGLNYGYKVVITSDHGQIASVGKGRLNVGVLAEQRSKRVAIFGSENICRSYMNQGIVDYKPYGMPPSMFPVFSYDLDSFDLQDMQSVSHGGITIDEAMVPVIELKK